MLVFALQSGEPGGDRSDTAVPPSAGVPAEADPRHAAGTADATRSDVAEVRATGAASAAGPAASPADASSIAHVGASTPEAGHPGLDPAEPGPGDGGSPEVPGGAGSGPLPDDSLSHLCRARTPAAALAWFGVLDRRQRLRAADLACVRALAARPGFEPLSERLRI